MLVYKIISKRTLHAF